MKQTRPRKRFGQHFLTDPGVLARLVDCLALQPADHVLEIGPGRGTLTRYLHGVACRCVAIEIDRDLVAGLKARLPGLEVVTADALAYDFTRLSEGVPWRIVGNLPYNISSPLLFKLMRLTAMHNAPVVQDMHFMLQREVAERLAAQPGGKAWGRLSVAAQFHFAVEALFEVRPESFSPPPKIFSALVRFQPRPQAPPAPARFEEVLRLAFSARRKRLANALKPLRPDWNALDLNPDLRPEQLSVADFVKIANAAG